MPNHVFISYSKQDRDYAEQFVTHMENLGFSVWIDDRIEPGSDWWLNIRQAIRVCGAFIVIMTPNSEVSSWVQAEILSALEFKKPIFPLLLNGETNLLRSDVWSKLAHIQYFDVRKAKMPDGRFMVRLEAHVEHEAKSVESAPPSVSSPPPPKIEITSSPEPDLKPAVGRSFIAEQPRTPFLEEAQLTKLIELVKRNADWTPVIRTINGIEMALVPPGCFMMGSENFERSQPVHQRCLEQPFWIGCYPITNAQYLEAVQAGICQSSGYMNDEHFNAPQQPVVGISWHNALKFAQWKQMRLPTETEWEFAGRGPDGLEYPWGNDFVADNLVYRGNSGRKTAMVGSRPGGISWVGALDLSGNVWEWCLSQWCDSYNEMEDNNINKTNIRRVLRGGAWYNYGRFARAASRGGYDPDFRHVNCGFRVVASPINI